MLKLHRNRHLQKIKDSFIKSKLNNNLTIFSTFFILVRRIFSVASICKNYIQTASTTSHWKNHSDDGSLSNFSVCSVNQRSSCRRQSEWLATGLSLGKLGKASSPLSLFSKAEITFEELIHFLHAFQSWPFTDVSKGAWKNSKSRYSWFNGCGVGPNHKYF